MLPTISACLVVYHEEKQIRRCLESLQNVAGEIIVVHDGECHDQTLEIAREFTGKIFIREHIGEAEPHRIFTFEQAQGEWILQLDADEFLLPKTQKEILRLVQDDCVDAYSFLWPMWDGHRQRTLQWPNKPILFRRSRLSFIGLPHAELKTSGILKKTALVLEHQPAYNNFTWHSWRTKWQRWIRVHAEYLRKDFSALEKFQATEKEWAKIILFSRRHPRLVAPILGLYYFLGSLRGGAWREGLWGWRVAFLQGLYYWQLWRTYACLLRPAVGKPKLENGK